MPKGVESKWRLVWDRLAGRRLERDAQDSLKKGTDPKAAKRNVQEVEGSFDRLRRVVVRVGAAIVAAFAVRRIAEFGRAMFRLGSEVAAVESQFRTVFGTIADGLEQSMEGWRAIAGVTTTEMRRLLAAAGSMAQGMGMTTRASADFASEVITLAGDLASFSGGMFTTEQAAQLLQSAIIGNTEAARSLLINFTAMDVQNRAMEQTGKATADALTQEERALAALSVITDRAGPQLGDLVRTQRDADNQAKQLAASFRSMREDIALSLIPTFQALFDALERQNVIERLTGLAGALADNMDEIVAAVGALIKALVIGGGIAAMVQLGGAIRAATAATTAWRGAMIGMQALMGPRGWFVLGVAALTEAFRRQGAAAREAASAQDAYVASFQAMNRAELDAEISALARQREQLERLRDAATSTAGREGWQRQIDKVIEAGMEAIRARNQLIEAASTAGTSQPDDGGPGGGRQRVLSGATVTNELPQTPSGDMDLLERAVPETEFDRFLDLFPRIQEAATSAAFEMTAAFEDAFRMMMEEGATMANFFEGVGRGLAGSMLQGLADFFRVKVKQNIAAAIEAAAYALGFTSHGNFPSAAAAWGAAAEHTAAATAWATAAGASGAGRAAVTGGRGAAPASVRDAGLGTARDIDRRQQPVIINIDPFNPANPVHTKQVGQAMELEVRLGGRRNWSRSG